MNDLVMPGGRLMIGGGWGFHVSCQRVDDESAGGGIWKIQERCLLVGEVELTAIEVNGVVRSARQVLNRKLR